MNNYLQIMSKLSLQSKTYNNIQGLSRCFLFLGQLGVNPGQKVNDLTCLDHCWLTQQVITLSGWYYHTKNFLPFFLCAYYIHQIAELAYTPQKKVMVTCQNRDPTFSFFKICPYNTLSKRFTPNLFHLHSKFRRS